MGLRWSEVSIELFNAALNLNTSQTAIMNKKKEKKRFKAKSFNRASVKIPSNTSESGQKITVFYKLKSQLSNLQLKTPVLR